ncbi:TIGR04024 family LLM class F420-dependent oxidoreductase [Halalkalicoccus jeotgali]|uniref:N5N10-methylenetetrahydromethanopterin reductase n=1 Tax=Halalkalicoccus jeotgali (strain DSM 18796 / CECT 7217 / JCM 14584 / KCTC 4019 / B3) TaxID=795797 RepID=D8J2F2_HALJB|nr:TIGR04024 family LLM class F420-dependent oxidoreductase [Halalkalicoccus jeotgali]ADJ14909.1 N5N10-methylenetetrahydromethanopterin reductase [Halalkalicoccus jeotgali B3]ELY39491.1 N5N10-methylenetetrahydromethanopterin reductase [Halalkalicoccus jeotgali B3]
MTARDVHLPVAAQSGVDSLVADARRAERTGYDRVWLPETWGRDAATVLAVIAERTDSVGLGASILPVYSRSPALIGQTAATLQEVSEGRFRLGIGPSGPAVIEGWHGESFERPLKRTRETVEIVRRVLSGERVEYDGEIFGLSGFRLRSDPPETAPGIDVAGLGPKSVELAGRFGDGWHAVVFTPDGIRDRLADLERGAELGDRDPAELRTTLSLTCCALADRERARELARQHTAFYVGGMGTYYRESLARQGYEEEANAVASAWGSGDREAALAAIPDELLDDLCAAGTPEEARETIERFEAVEGLDAVAVSFPRGASEDEIEATIDTLAP